MTALISLCRWSKGGFSGRYSGHNNHHRPPKKVRIYKGFKGKVVVVVLF
jgi:hypothetical protein